MTLPVTFFQILVALADQDAHGYAIMQDVLARTGGQLKLSPGTLYGAIKRMLEDGLIVEINEDDQRRRYYRITESGRRAAMVEAARLSTLVDQAKAIGWLPKRS